MIQYMPLKPDSISISRVHSSDYIAKNNQKRDTINLNEEESLHIVNLLKMLLNSKQMKMTEEKKLPKNSSTFINIPVIQLVIINNQSTALHPPLTEKKLKIDQAKSIVFSFLTEFAYLTVMVY